MYKSQSFNVAPCDSVPPAKGLRRLKPPFFGFCLERATPAEQGPSSVDPVVSFTAHDAATATKAAVVPADPAGAGTILVATCHVTRCASFAGSIDRCGIPPSNNVVAGVCTVLMPVMVVWYIA